MFDVPVDPDRAPHHQDEAAAVKDQAFLLLGAMPILTQRPQEGKCRLADPNVELTVRNRHASDDDAKSPVRTQIR
jgi:hypothetical protein